MGIFSSTIQCDISLWGIVVILIQGYFLQEVRAADVASLHDTVQRRLNTSGANEYTPQFTGTPYKVEVLENIPVGSAIFQVSAVDGDRGENGRVSYVLLQGTQNFEVDENTGLIKTRSFLDREMADHEMLLVEAHDHGTPHKSTVVKVPVHILDVNDNAPVFSKDIYRSGIWDGSRVGQVAMRQINAFDADVGSNAELSYSLVHSNNPTCHNLSIDPKSGVIRVAHQLNEEGAFHISPCKASVIATDGGVPPLSSTAKVIIEIVTINDII
ncbi:protein dachsous-like [Saccostrea echinata]|uniref:protein dachsous-like n=1 Tax=Saccostrea echinata TaxID=191078 RepID=UPI002A7EF26A|nr:protein dachsous-like [Saccostrea echinata]